MRQYQIHITPSIGTGLLNTSENSLSINISSLEAGKTYTASIRTVLCEGTLEGDPALLNFSIPGEFWEDQLLLAPTKHGMYMYTCMYICVQLAVKSESLN